MIKLKIHSTLQHLTDASEYNLAVTNPREVLSFLTNAQPKFSKYLSHIKTNQTDESISFVDCDYKLISTDAFELKHFKENETVHVVPLVTGGGGKRGFLIFAVFAAGVVATGGLAAFGAGGFGAGLPNAMTMGGSTATSSFGLGNIAKVFSGMPSFARSLLTNVGLSILSSVFTKKPKPTEQVDSSSRGSDMFGSLQNTTTSGSPIPLVYGQSRVAGQFISGYLNTVKHGRNDVVNVSEQFDAS